jgi:hypothetical protein
MRNEIHQASKNAFALTNLVDKKDEFSYLVVGSIGLFLVATGLSHIVAERTLQNDDLIPVYEKSQKLVNPPAESKKSSADQTSISTSCMKERSFNSSAVLDRDLKSKKKLASHIESMYKIPSPMAQEIVATAISVSKENGMDPFLALGMIAKESSFNHKAKSGYGATGLMQVYAAVHKNVLGDLGVHSSNPKVVQKMLTTRVRLNVAAGIKIYKSYEKQYGSRVKALQAYNGARQDPSYAYANKVLGMREEFRNIVLLSEACT